VATAIEAIAEELFFRDAGSVEMSGVVPEQHFEALASAGLYGAFAPSDIGDHASRLWREAAFVLVFSSSPMMKAALSGRFTTDRL